jgi:hypothetical protein
VRASRLVVHLVVCAVLSGCATANAPESADTAPVLTSRQRLDAVQRQASEQHYDAAIAEFEKIRAADPDAITSLDALRIVVVYGEIGNLTKHDELSRWLVERHRSPKTAIDAERSIRGYIVHPSAKDQALLSHAASMARFASENAAKEDQGKSQGFFETSRGVAAYRAGRYPEASKFLATTVDHPSVYVRSLSLPFYAMSERARGNRKMADTLAERARSTAATLPFPGGDEYGVNWTDVLIARKALEKMETVLSK